MNILKKSTLLTGIITLSMLFSSMVALGEDLPIIPTSDLPDMEAVEEAPITATVVISADREIVYTVSPDGVILKMEITTDDGVTVLESEDLGELLISSTLQNIIDNTSDEYPISVFVTSGDETLLNTLVDQFTTITGAPVDALLLTEEAVSEDEVIEEPANNFGTPENETILERFQLATEFGVTPGRMNLLQRLFIASGESIDYAEWADATVKDIMTTIRAYQSGSLTEEAEEVDNAPEPSEEITNPIPTPSPAPTNNGNGNSNNNGNQGNKGNKGNGKNK